MNKFNDILLKGRNLIQIFVGLDFEIMEIDFGDSSAIFICNSFEKDSSNAIGSSNFISFEGIEITDVFSNVNVNSNLMQLKANLEAKVRDREFMRYEFSSNHIWRYYQKN